MTEDIVNDSLEENWHALPVVPTRVRSIQMKACLACRRVKMKCRLQSGETRCARCAHKTIECVFLEHRRGRKPGTRIMRKSTSGNNAKNASQDTIAPESGAEEGYAARPASPDTYNESQFPAETSGLQPSELLNHEAMRGKFSMQRILDTHLERVDNAIPERPFLQPTQDAIEIGLVSQSIAEHLFRSFMDILNPYISQLDPDLHTFSYVRQKSSFLLGSILAVSSKMFNPSLYKRLYRYTEELFLENFRVGFKSTETVQAILMLTYWKEPEDTRSWVNLGYAIRICMDLGWHKLKSQAIRDRSGMTDTELRETRNIERTWFLLFVYDRSLSLQTGKPWMIERSGFIESIEHWSKERAATANDTLLAAFVTLRLLTSEVFKLLGPCRHASSFENIKSFLTIIGNRIDEWEDKWLQAYNNESECCHPFLIRFYGTHLRLQLYSLPLQEILGSNSENFAFDMAPLWESYSNAIAMLKLVCHFSARLYFAQDSIHVMTAYSAAFLIKLLMSAPTYITSEIEPITIDTLRTAAAVFSEQSAPPGSSCFLQSRFLAKIITNYDRMRNTDHDNSTLNNTQLHFNPHEPPHETTATVPDTTPVSTRERRLDELPQYQQNPPYQYPGSSQRVEEGIHEHEQQSDSLTRRLIAHGGPGNTSLEILHQENHNPVFTDDETWAGIFNSAGFCIQDGVFFS